MSCKYHCANDLLIWWGPSSECLSLWNKHHFTVVVEHFKEKVEKKLFQGGSLKIKSQSRQQAFEKLKLALLDEVTE